MAGKMKLFKEFDNFKLKLSSRDLFFSYIKDLHKRNIDFRVWLPSLSMNLQRDFVWTIEQKRELIASLFIGRDIPPISVMSICNSKKNYSGVSDDILQIIDGKQRLYTFLEFYSNGFSIVDKEKEYYYKELDNEFQQKYKYYIIKCQTAYEDWGKPFTDYEKVQWFRLINFAGTPQDKYHIDKLKQLEAEE